MEPFSALLDALVYTTSRNRKLALIAAYLRAAPDPDRGWALAGLTGGLDFPAVKSSTIRNLMMERVDPLLWNLSRDFVGDTAETASLLWPEPETQAPQDDLSLTELVERLAGADPVDGAGRTAGPARPDGCQRSLCPDQAGHRAGCGSACRRGWRRSRLPKPSM